MEIKRILFYLSCDRKRMLSNVNKKDFVTFFEALKLYYYYAVKAKRSYIKARNSFQKSNGPQKTPLGLLLFMQKRASFQMLLLCSQLAYFFHFIDNDPLGMMQCGNYYEFHLQGFPASSFSSCECTEIQLVQDQLIAEMLAGKN